MSSGHYSNQALEHQPAAFVRLVPAPPFTPSVVLVPVAVGVPVSVPIPLPVPLAVAVAVAVSVAVSVGVPVAITIHVSIQVAVSVPLATVTITGVLIAVSLVVLSVVAVERTHTLSAADFPQGQIVGSVPDSGLALLTLSSIFRAWRISDPASNPAASCQSRSRPPCLDSCDLAPGRGRPSDGDRTDGRGRRGSRGGSRRCRWGTGCARGRRRGPCRRGRSPCLWSRRPHCQCRPGSAGRCKKKPISVCGEAQRMALTTEACR